MHLTAESKLGLRYPNTDEAHLIKHGHSAEEENLHSYTLVLDIIL